MTGNKNKKLIIAFMCPALAVMIFFFALPVAMTIFYSFTNLSLTWLINKPERPRIYG